MEPTYGGVIWTKHALLRLQERQIKQEDALATLKHPERSRFAHSRQAWVYNRTFGKTDIEVVASQNNRHEWVVVSVWSRQGYRNNHRYLVRNGIVDWLIDSIIGLFSKKNHGTRN